VGLLPSLVVALLAVAVLVALQVRHVRTVKAQRRAILDGVAPLFSELQVTQVGIGFPALTGVYDGDRVKVQFVVDTLVMRQLPRLWLMLTVARRLPVDNPVEILLRPRGGDNVTASAQLPYEHRPPPGWPEDCRIGTARPDAPYLQALEDSLPMLRDPRTKSLIVGPGGVRVAYELAKGDISRHRVIRRAKFDVALEPEQLRPLIERVRDVARDVELAELEALVRPDAARPHAGA
jgi:hypothetical protein